MKKELDGAELAEFVKERQAKAVRGLLQQWKIQPKLVIISEDDNGDFVKKAIEYAEDILVTVETYSQKDLSTRETIDALYSDNSVHAIFISADNESDAKLIEHLPESKDVGGILDGSKFEPPMMTSAEWLLTGYNINLAEMKILVLDDTSVASRKLVEKWASMNYDVALAENATDNLDSDVVILVNGSVDELGQFSPESIVVDEKCNLATLSAAALLENVITAARPTLNPAD